MSSIVPYHAIFTRRVFLYESTTTGSTNNLIGLSPE